jgi:predicted metal-dependent hydrolase
MTAPDDRVAWRRSSRARRISLRIDSRSGRVVVTLPTRTPRAAGQALLARHADWIRTRLAALPEPVPLVPDALIPIHGIPRRLRHDPTRGASTRLGPAELAIGGDPAFLARRTLDFLRAEARRHLGALALRLAAQVGLAPSRVTVRDTRTRWGSCTQTRALMFSWRLILAPAFVQHYVVAHEVAHLRHFDHGAQFWSLVDRLTPHRQSATDWLGRNASLLMRIG